jgi:lipoprotein Spr
MAEGAGNTIEWLNPLAFKYSLELDLPVEELANEKLLRFLEDWVGVKYRLGGDSKAGIDCSALTRRIMRDVYSLTVGRVIPDQFKAGIEISKSELQMGDLIFFKISNRRPGPTHVGFYLGNNRFIHASIKKGVTIENLEKPYYQTYYRSAVRLPK